MYIHVCTYFVKCHSAQSFVKILLFWNLNMHTTNLCTNTACTLLALLSTKLSGDFPFFSESCNHWSTKKILPTNPTSFLATNWSWKFILGNLWVVFLMRMLSMRSQAMSHISDTLWCHYNRLFLPDVLYQRERADLGMRLFLLQLVSRSWSSEISPEFRNCIWIGCLGYLPTPCFTVFMRWATRRNICRNL